MTAAHCRSTDRPGGRHAEVTERAEVEHHSQGVGDTLRGDVLAQPREVCRRQVQLREQQVDVGDRLGHGERGHGDLQLEHLLQVLGADAGLDLPSRRSSG